MDVKELLSQYKLSEDELKQILSNYRKPEIENIKFISHKDLNEKFHIVDWKGNHTEYSSAEKFLNRLESIFVKTPYGCNTYQFYSDFIQDVKYGNPESAMKLVKKVIANCTQNPNYAVQRTIELFNSKDEVIYNVYYNNIVIENLDDLYSMLMHFKGFSESQNEDKNLRELVGKGLNYLKDLVDIKKEGVSYWDEISKDPYAKAEREHCFKKLKTVYATLKTSEGSEYAINNDKFLPVLNLIKKQYQY